jgi:hypothetical protein
MSSSAECMPRGVFEWAIDAKGADLDTFVMSNGVFSNWKFK